MRKVIIGEKAPFPWIESVLPFSAQREYVDHLKRANDFEISTNSLFLLRELEIAFDDLVVYNTDTGLTGDIDSVGEISMLQEELKQSDRYLNKND